MNATNLEAAEVALKLAELALKQYIKGTYPQIAAQRQHRDEAWPRSTSRTRKRT